MRVPAVPSRRAAGSAAASQRSNERWSMDFVSDCLAGGRAIRALTLVDDYTRECLAIKVETSSGGLGERDSQARAAGGDCGG